MNRRRYLIEFESLRDAEAFEATLPDGQVQLYHGGPRRVRRVTDDGVFEGLFTSADPGVAASHGDCITVIRIEQDGIMRTYDLAYDTDYDVVARAIREETPASTDEEVEMVFDAVVDQEERPEGDELIDILRVDWEEAGWEIQRIRGAIAARLGYAAAEMDDEHGTSYLVFPGADVVGYVRCSE